MDHIDTILLGASILVSVGLAVWRLWHDFRWRRKQYAVDMLSQWNQHTAEHRRAIDESLPQLLETVGKGGISPLTLKKAQEIYNCTQENKANCELSSHLIELLNYCEFVSVSYTRKVAEKKLIEGSFKKTLIVWHEALLPYMGVTQERRGYNPWKPFSDLVKKWGGLKGLDITK